MGKNKHKKNNKQTSSPIISTNPSTPNVLDPIKEEHSPELLSLEQPVNKLVEPIDNTLEHSTIEETKEPVEVVAEEPKETVEPTKEELKEPVEVVAEEPAVVETKETLVEPTKEETAVESTKEKAKEEPKVTLEQLKEPEPVTPKKEEVLEKPNTTVTNKKQSFCVIF